LLKVQIVAVGKNKDDWVEKGLEHYLKLLSRYSQTTLTIIPNLNKSKALSPVEIKHLEALEITKKVGGNFLVALSETGKSFDSLKFSDKIMSWQTAGKSSITFLIGGAFGLDQKIIEKADFVLSLSSMTFSHQIVRLVLLEQLYRAFSILKGTDYHK